MKRCVSDWARQLATELERLFAKDTDLADRLNDAHRRLLEANDRLWSGGVDPDGLRALQGGHPRSGGPRLATAGHGRSQVLDSSDPVGALQEGHWQIHRAHGNHLRVAEDRRRLPADIGEVTRSFVDELVAAGWSEDEARNATVRELHAPSEGCRDDRPQARPDRSDPHQ